MFTICHTRLPGIPCVPCFNEYVKQNSTPDGVVDYYLPQVLTANDYYPFGMIMPGRKYSEGNYRYGFNGKENDNDVKGEGNQQDYGMRIYDPRLGKFLSVDPLTHSFPWYTPYQYAGNKPVFSIDLDGEEDIPYYHARTHARDGRTVIKQNTFEFNENGRQYRAARYPTKLRDPDGFFQNRTHARELFFVEDKSLVNESDFEVGDGSVIRTKGTHWHYWMHSNEGSISYKVAKDLTRKTGIAIFGLAAGVSGGYALPIAKASATARLVSSGIDYVAQVAGNYLSGKGGRDAWSDVNVTSIGLSFLNPGSSWKALLQNNFISSGFSISLIEGYTGVGSGKDVSTMINQAVIGTFVGRLTRNLDLSINKLNIRLDHVNEILPKGNDLSKYLQGRIETFQNRINKISAVTGTGVNYINNKIDKASENE